MLRLDKYADKVAFAGRRDYAQDPYGTVEVIEKLTPEQTKAYYQSILTRSRMVIVVVADLDKSSHRTESEPIAGHHKTGGTL